MATTFAMRLCAFQTFGLRRMPATRMPHERHTNTPLRGYTNFGQLFAIIVAL